MKKIFSMKKLSYLLAKREPLVNTLRRTIMLHFSDDSTRTQNMQQQLKKTSMNKRCVPIATEGLLSDTIYRRVTWPYQEIWSGNSILKTLKIWHIFTLDPLGGVVWQGHCCRTFLFLFFKSWLLPTRWHNEIGAIFSHG